MKALHCRGWPEFARFVRGLAGVVIDTARLRCARVVHAGCPHPALGATPGLPGANSDLRLQRIRESATSPHLISLFPFLPSIPVLDSFALFAPLRAKPLAQRRKERKGKA